MPHSGGGGSHSGGHSHSSHSSHSSHNNYNSHRSRHSYSKYKQFENDKKYLYYYNGEPQFYYASNPTSKFIGKMESIPYLFIGFVFSLLTIIFSFAFWDVEEGTLALDYDTAIVVDDEIGIVKDRANLIGNLQEFQVQTGVTVAVVTRTPENAYPGYDCKNQSYNFYIDNFADESHWLIYYVGQNADRSDDWQWHLMCGDDCVKVLPRSQEDRFTDIFHECLLDSDRYCFDDCVKQALSALDYNTKKRMVYADGVSENGYDVSGEPVDITAYILFGIFGLVGIVMLIIAFKHLLKKPTEQEIARSKAVEVPWDTNSMEAKCIYCGGKYIRGTVANCPYCNVGLQ